MNDRHRGSGSEPASVLFNGQPPTLDSSNTWRTEVSVAPGVVTSENLDSLTDIKGYRAEFLKLFGFGLPGVDYEKDAEPVRSLPSQANQ